jgi:putative acetyltransferase
MHTGAMMTLTLEAPDMCDARTLMQRLDAELRARYPESSVHRFNPGEVANSKGAFVIARAGGQAVSWGAVRPLAPGLGEVKRMFVEPEVRGRGVARQILRTIESAARDLGFRILRLETGTRQPEATRLYESAEYVRIPRIRGVCR